MYMANIDIDRLFKKLIQKNNMIYEKNIIMHGILISSWKQIWSKIYFLGKEILNVHLVTSSSTVRT